MSSFESNAKNSLLAHYASKTPKRFRQIDGFANWRGDQLDKDGDGYVVMSGETQELMVGASVRVLIPFETTQADAAVLLRKVLRTIERAGHVDSAPTLPNPSMRQTELDEMLTEICLHLKHDIDLDADQNIQVLRRACDGLADAINHVNNRLTRASRPRAMRGSMLVAEPIEDDEIPY